MLTHPLTCPGWPVAVLACLLGAGHAAGRLEPTAGRPLEGTRIHGTPPDEVVRARVHESYGSLPLSFEANTGQTDPAVKFLARGAGYNVFLTSTEAVFSLKSPVRPPREGDVHAPVRAAVIRMTLVGAQAPGQIAGVDELPGRNHYLKSGDPGRWRVGVPTYRRVKHGSVYSGIDLVYYGNQRALEYDFVVAPGADPAVIQLRFSGADRLTVDEHGDLILAVDDRQIRQLKPVVYQDIEGRRREVSSRYVVAGDQVGFALEAYDVSRPLVIDPVLVYSSYLGGSSPGPAGGDQGLGIAVDQNGHAYVTGLTYISDFPTVNAIQPVSGGESDAFVTKVSPDGLSMLYSTFLGGAENENIFDSGAIAVDIAGNAFVAGVTSSSDFPTTPGAYRSPTVNTTRGEVFVAKVDASGSALIYSTLIGAGHVYAIAIDSAGSAYLTGHTDDATYPTVNPVQTDLRGEVDAFVTKLDPTGSALVYSTFLGGTGEGLFWFIGDTGHGIAVDPEGNAYIAGQTDSPDFPTTIGARQPLYGGGTHDGFITKLDAAGSTIVYSTFLGGAAADGARSLALDTIGRVTVAGFTRSVNFPTAQALQPQHASDNGDTDAFVARLDATGSQLLYSTYLGGNSSDVASGVAVDQAGNTYVIGTTLATDFPTVRPLGPSFADGAASEAFVTKLGPTGSSMLYSTYLGGDGVEFGDAIAVDALGSAYVTGSTFAPSEFPTVNPFQPVSGGGIDAFVAKIADPCPEDVTSRLGVFGFPPLPIPFIPINVQWVILWNPTSHPIPGPLAFVMDDLQNAIFIGSALTTRCAPFDGDPYTVVATGSDGVLSPGESSVAVLWFLKTGTGRLRYQAHVLAGLPTQ